MNTLSNDLTFWPNPFVLDFTVLESDKPVEYPNSVRVVGAARSRNRIIFVPLTELGATDGTKPRKIRLHIPPMLGMMRLEGHSLHRDGGASVKEVMDYLRQAGVEEAFLHVDLQGMPDVDHDSVLLFDQETGKPLFRSFDRTSPTPDLPGMKQMIMEANNFMTEPEIVELEEVLKPPALLTTHVRALAAAIEGATRTVQNDHS